MQPQVQDLENDEREQAARTGQRVSLILVDSHGEAKPLLPTFRKVGDFPLPVASTDKNTRCTSVLENAIARTRDEEWIFFN